MARKCTLPKRAPAPGTGFIPKDEIPCEALQYASNWLAFRSFLYDYCMHSSNRNLSKGYLSNLEPLALRQGQQSDLVKGCQAVGFASHGKPLCRPMLVAKAEGMYQELLGSLARRITNPSVDGEELKLLVILLGLYQITLASMFNRGEHEIHAHGLIAIRGIESSPYSLLMTALSVPALCAHDESLTDLLLGVDLLWTRHQRKTQHSAAIENLDAAIVLHGRFTRWQDSRSAEFKPTAVGSIKTHDDYMTACRWPGLVHTYIDLYVAGVWNIFRTAKLLLDLLIISFNVDTEVKNVEDFRRDAITTTEDLIASIPYHLVENLPAFVQDISINLNADDSTVGRHVGGLLIMHPLYIASRMPFLPTEIRDYMRNCLQWIGENMGIGQANVFANDGDISRAYLESGLMVIWAGFSG